MCCYIIIIYKVLQLHVKVLAPSRIVLMTVFYYEDSFVPYSEEIYIPSKA